MSCSLAAIGLSALFAFVFDPANNLYEVGCSYFASASSHAWRARLPGNEFLYFTAKGRSGDRIHLTGPNGWRGVLTEKEAVLLPPGDKGKGIAEYHYAQGNLVEIVQDGRHHTFEYPDVFPCPNEQHPPKLWKTREDFSAADLQDDIWAGGSRLRLWYKNPNKAATLLAEILLVALAALMFFPLSLEWKIHLALWFAISLVVLVQTQSRGGLLAFFLGAAALIGCRVMAKWGKSRKAVLFMALGGILLGAVAAFGCKDRLDKAWNKGSFSDQARFMTWPSVPKMVACGTGGWIEPVTGLTFVNWFEDLGCMVMPKDMINEHFTFLVKHGKVLRFAYLCGWLGLLFSLAAFAKKNALARIPLVAFMAVFITSGFNRIYGSPSLWVIPFASLLWFGFGLRKFEWKRTVFCAFGAAAVLAALTLVIVQVVGTAQASGDCPSVNCDGSVVFVNGRNPRHWLVMESSVLNESLVGKEIRSFYRANPAAPSLGFVRDWADLPRSVEHLTLVGRGCEDFLAHYKENSQGILPRRLTFLSPTVKVWEIPPDLPRRCQFEYVVGSLLARYGAEMDQEFPPWCVLVPGAEIYLPNWMVFCVNEAGKHAPTR